MATSTPPTVSSSPSSPTSKILQAVSPELRAVLNPTDLDRLQVLEEEWGFSFQQLKLTAGWFVDCRMWAEDSFWTDLTASMDFLQGVRDGAPISESESARVLRNPKQAGRRLFQKMQESHQVLASKAKIYPSKRAKEALPGHAFVEKELKGRIFRLCPAASEKAVCCNLKVLNIVDNCAMACSYCVLQNHYEQPNIAVPNNLKVKLDEIELVPGKRYRIGTGEYSDSLLWGNRNNILRDLCEFASKHPNIILEFKTKSAHVGWLLENDVPANVCCTWSLNPQTIIDHEEHKTANLSRRLAAAREVANKGIKVGFHIHPMFYFHGWEQEYQQLIARVMDGFSPEEVLWISLGCITLLKGFAQDFRLKFRHSKLLQMETEMTPDGKITYAFAVREKLYHNALAALEPWRESVFQYLCMEHAPMWDSVMGFHYPNMGEFDDRFNDSVFSKLSL